MLYDDNSRLAEIGREIAFYAGSYFKKINGIVYSFFSLKRTSNFLDETIVEQNSARTSAQDANGMSRVLVERVTYSIEGIPIRVP